MDCLRTDLYRMQSIRRFVEEACAWNEQLERLLGLPPTIPAVPESKLSLNQNVLPFLFYLKLHLSASSRRSGPAQKSRRSPPATHGTVRPMPSVDRNVPPEAGEFAAACRFSLRKPIETVCAGRAHFQRPQLRWLRKRVFGLVQHAVWWQRWRKSFEGPRVTLVVIIKFVILPLLTLINTIKQIKQHKRFPI